MYKFPVAVHSGLFSNWVPWTPQIQTLQLFLLLFCCLEQGTPRFIVILLPSGLSVSTGLAEPLTTQLLVAPYKDSPAWRRFSDMHLWWQVTSSFSYPLLLYNLQTSLDLNHPNSTLFESGAIIIYSIVRLDINNQYFSHSPIITIALFHLRSS